MQYDDEIKLTRENIEPLLQLGLHAHIEIIRQDLEEIRFRADQGID